MTPYELRYEVLKTARDVLEHQFAANMELWKLGEKTVASLPKPPGLDEMLKFAETMNGFVSGK